MDALKHSLTPASRRGSGEHKRKQSPRPGAKSEPQSAATIDLKVESPPLLFIGPPSDPNGEDSTGALFSSQLQLNVLVPNVNLMSYETRLICIVKHIHPVEKNCPDCLSKTTELKKWTHLSEPRTYKRGEHSLPLQYLFPGHLPATVHGGAALATVEYRLISIAKTSTGEEIKHDSEIDIRRAIPPGSDKHSVRIFPPTNLTVNVTLQPIVHPIGEIPVSMRIDGVTDFTKKDAFLRWRLRKLNWKIEETHKMVSPPCAKHAGKVGGPGKGVHHEDIRTVGQAELKDGWKSDFDQGRIELEFKAAVNPNLKPTCDVDAPNGLSVTHALVLELVVAEEWAPKNHPKSHTPTGAARILRTQFALTLTERMGMGIAWDQEMPPMYEDVPPSPPTYNTGTVGDLDAASLRELDEELGDLDLERPLVPPPAFLEERARFSADDLETAEASSSTRNGEDQTDGVEAPPDVEAGTST
ncbi:hypothetical protein NA57DRAFT_30998 [Rhizodiscina lignyota]|uniref:LDB19 N-terminal domain-containing protein n=1 Tax=Rhizodiscina lignyota TaxID=1504668 RepID=A0A9P4MGY2_9PEZI|nr:hypothetical protein NA57DRAFT_30998 [Rhizodiscina lignyota]